MMDWTDRHCRYFHRLIAPSLTLYTEMVITGALIHGEAERFLRFDKSQHPVVLQLGGSDPDDLATSAKMGEVAGYNEINLNCGCPSERVQSGSFGACLMKEPALVASCIKAMQNAVNIPVTVKCRVGIDDSDDYNFLKNFIETVSKQGGCQTFIVHARKAWLKGLSPKENREVPPLQYEIAEKIRTAFPDLNIQVNGGIRDIERIQHLLRHPVGTSAGGLHERDLQKSSASLNTSGSPLLVSANADRGDDSFVGFDGVMIGREAYQNPWFLRQVEEEFYGTENLPSAEEIVMQMIPYIIDQQKRYETPVKSITRHMTGLFQGIPGARTWRQVLSTEVHQDDVTAEILKTALDRAFHA